MGGTSTSVHITESAFGPGQIGIMLHEVTSIRHELITDKSIKYTVKYILL